MKTSEVPEQRPMDMDSFVDTRKAFEKAFKETMTRIAIDIYKGAASHDGYMDFLDQEYERFFNSMKGATKINRTDIEELVKA